MQNIKFESVEEYISAQPQHAGEILEQIRSTIKHAAPNAIELISYGMPAFKQDGILVYYAAWKSHIGFYPAGSGIKDFEEELSGYKTSKGAIQFPFDKPMPLDLISRIVKLRVRENQEKAVSKPIRSSKS